MKQFEAFCHVCLGGGKVLGGRPLPKRQAAQEANSHMRLYGHRVSLLPVDKPKKHPK